MILLEITSLLFRSKNVEKNISYGDNDVMKYDLYLSEAKKSPVVIFWHGGSWQNGNKNDYKFVGAFLQKNGYNGVVADYPKYPDQTFPGFIKDARTLVDVLRKKFPKSKVYLMGHSAGGHTALITAMKQRENPVDGVIALATVNWFVEKNWPRWEKIFTDTYESKKQETYSYVESSPKTTKYLLMHGTNDVTVSPKGSAKLHEYLMINNIPSINKQLDGVNHWMILGIFVPGIFGASKHQIRSFIEN